MSETPTPDFSSSLSPGDKRTKLHGQDFTSKTERNSDARLLVQIVTESQTNEDPTARFQVQNWAKRRRKTSRPCSNPDLNEGSSNGKISRPIRTGGPNERNSKRLAFSSHSNNRQTGTDGWQRAIGDSVVFFVVHEPRSGAIISN
jgi:hypothetical protein